MEDTYRIVLNLNMEEDNLIPDKYQVLQGQMPHSLLLELKKIIDPFEGQLITTAVLANIRYLIESYLQEKVDDGTIKLCH